MIYKLKGFFPLIYASRDPRIWLVVWREEWQLRTVQTGTVLQDLVYSETRLSLHNQCNSKHIKIVYLKKLRFFFFGVHWINKTIAFLVVELLIRPITFKHSWMICCTDLMVGGYGCDQSFLMVHGSCPWQVFFFHEEHT